MKRPYLVATALLVVILAVAGCTNYLPNSGWVTLLEGGEGLENWNRLGGANWTVVDGAVQADKSTSKGASFLVSKNTGKWNVYEITAVGPEMTVKLNGAVTVHLSHKDFPSGPIALQYGAGVVKFRKVQVRPL